MELGQKSKYFLTRKKNKEFITFTRKNSLKFEIHKDVSQSIKSNLHEINKISKNYGKTFS